MIRRGPAPKPEQPKTEKPTQKPAVEQAAGPAQDALILAMAKLQADTIAKAVQGAVAQVVAAMDRNAPAEGYTFTIQHDSSGKPVGLIARRGKTAK